MAGRQGLTPERIWVLATRTVALLVYVVFPILGMLYFDWDWRNVLVLYVLQNCSAYLLAFVKIARARPSSDSKFQAVRQHLGRIYRLVVHVGLIYYIALSPRSFGLDGWGISDSVLQHYLFFPALVVSVQLLLSTLQVMVSPPGEVYKAASEYTGRVMVMHVATTFFGYGLGTADAPRLLAIGLVAINGLFTFWSWRDQDRVRNSE